MRHDSDAKWAPAVRRTKDDIEAERSGNALYGDRLTPQEIEACGCSTRAIS